MSNKVDICKYCKQLKEIIDYGACENCIDSYNKLASDFDAEPLALEEEDEPDHHITGFR